MGNAPDNAGPARARRRKSLSVNMKPTLWVTAVLLSSMLAPAALGAIQVVTDRNDEEAATGAFQFKTVPPPSRQDAAERGTFTLVEGQPDLNSGDVRTLNDGKVPREGDQPAENFFFRAGSAGGRLQLDLGTNAVLRQINTYSWHPGTRGPQVYRLFASDGSAAAFQAAPKRDTDPAAAGWRLLATVDTRPQEDALGGQYGVSVQDSNGPLGTFRYLLFDIARTEGEDPFGQTFYSEIDVLAAGSTATPLAAEATKRITQGFEADGGKYRFTIDTTLAPDLTGWADRELRPVVQEWYPRLIGLLPSEGFHPRTNVTLRFRDDMGGTPASAGGGFINCNAGWFRDELNREAPGSVVHEMVHVVQSYARGRRSGPDTARLPGWLVEIGRAHV